MGSEFKRENYKLQARTGGQTKSSGCQGQGHAAVQQSLATAKPHPAALHPVHEVFVLGLSVHLPPQEDTVPPEQPSADSCSPAFCRLPVAVQLQLEVLAVVMVAEVLPQEPSFPLQLLALALLEDSQYHLPPCVCQGEVPHRQLHP